MNDMTELFRDYQKLLERCDGLEQRFKCLGFLCIAFGLPMIALLTVILLKLY